MGIEIERRFLVCDPNAAVAGGEVSPVRIAQGYFGRVDRLRVRVRIASARNDCQAFLAFKGARKGFCRPEFEYPLALDRARRALDALPAARIIRKTRYEIPCRDGLAWSIDQFEGLNSGLVIAEIELIHPDQQFERPAWLGEEVTFNSNYSNFRLSRAPMRQRLAIAA